MPKLIKRKPVPDDPWSIDPDALLFSDLHLYDRPEFKRVDPTTGLNVRLQEGLNVLDQIYELLTEHKEIESVFCLGDAFEQKDRIPTHVLLNFRYKLERILKMFHIHYIHLMGNHDYNLLQYPTLEIFNNYDNFVFIKEPTELGMKWFGCLPYQRDHEEFKRAWNKFYTNPEIRVVLMHQLIPGAKYETGKTVPGNLSLVARKNVLYLSGDAHMPQLVNGIQYLGSPYQIRFSDEGQPRYIWLMNSSTLEIRPLELNCSKFLSFDVLESAMDDQVKGNYVRIIGEVEPGEYDTKARKAIHERLEEAGAKAVVFNLKIKRPSQTKIPEGIVDNDEAVIRKYAEDSMAEMTRNPLGLQLTKLIETGVAVYNGL
jgi:DNA repair exonuclease SbcCD nuclease subunit